ncbi:glycine betaine/proline transport system substrate-binding protein [Modicisalibacter muralis]|uniref:Glycine betaine/proline transport system substrate-binding protein n=1 Tax=Modicisalibacter muralis TaxID=119000 RepID=A0A1G9PMY0_9GAMM|nr:ABC transporter substrate-binding protein [Halomonas muralis]SDL99861.1 glycine betaine/proline transport system substrate-binding protein [Halomonas muralis]
MINAFSDRLCGARKLLGASLLAAAGLLVPFSSAYADSGADDVKLATPPWPGATVKTEVARQLLDSLGYQASVEELSTAMILQGMESGDIDITMTLWRPSQGSMLDPRLETGELVEVVKNIQGARFQLAVPDYVWEAGVHSLEDLAANAERFDSTFYGIEAGNVGNEIMQKAIDENSYGLADWRVRASSVTGMLSQVEAQAATQEWIAFLGWEPHWMNVAYDLRYLEDPKGIWGKSSSVSTVASTAFLDEHPNLARFLEQMTVPIEVQNNWVTEFSLEERPLEEVASEWIAANPEMVGEWLEGVTTADGERSAQELLVAR